MPNNDRPVAAGWDALADAQTGRLTRPTALDRLDRPAAVELLNRDLAFVWEGIVRRYQVPPNLLDRFLGATTDGEILRFAQRWGQLRVVESADDWGQKAWTIDLDRFHGTYYRREGAAILREPLDGWRHFQTVFRATLKLAAALQENAQRIDRSLLLPLQSREFFEFTSPTTAEWPRWSTAQHRAVAARVLTYWTARLADTCGLRPMLLFEGGHESAFTVVFSDASSADGSGHWGISLIGALTFQLFTTIAARGFAVCSGCGGPYAPNKRRPSQGRRRYCSRCRAAGIPQRDAKRDYRARESECKDGRR
jgi:hypothetical protein